MNNFFRLLGIAAMATVMALSLAGCPEPESETSSSTPYPRWREELRGAPVTGTSDYASEWWKGGSNFGSLIFRHRPTANGDWLARGSTNFDLIAVDDKPIGQESSFTVKIYNVDCIIKYILKSDTELEITDTGAPNSNGYQYIGSGGTYTKQ